MHFGKSINLQRVANFLGTFSLFQIKLMKQLYDSKMHHPTHQSYFVNSDEINSLKLTFFAIFLLQKRVVRAISFVHFTAPSSPIFSDLKILKLHDLFQLKLLSFVYDCVNRTSPSCFHSFFDLVESVHRYGTRQVTKKDIFLTQKNTLQYGIRSVRFFGAKCWNDIPVDIKRSPSANIFPQKLKAFLFQNHYKS